MAPLVWNADTSVSLLVRVQNGENAAWSRLVQLYAPLLKYWFRQAGIPEEEIEDLIQTVWFSVAPRLSSFAASPNQRFRAWLRGVTRHQALLWHRKRPRQVARAEGGSEIIELLGQVGVSEPPAEDTVDPGELREIELIRRQALEKVRVHFRNETWQAFLAFAIEGRPAAAVAAELGMTESAVRMAKSRILNRVRRELGDLLD